MNYTVIYNRKGLVRPISPTRGDFNPDVASVRRRRKQLLRDIRRRR